MPKEEPIEVTGKVVDDTESVHEENLVIPEQ